jgi:hypothetical protein
MDRTTALSEPVRVWSGAPMAPSASAPHVRCSPKATVSHHRLSALTVVGLLRAAKGSSFSNISLLIIHEGKSGRRAANRSCWWVAGRISASIASSCRSSLDHLIGGVQEFVRDAEAERLGGLEVDRELERRRLLERQLGWIGAV